MNKVTFDKFGEALNLLEDVKYAIETDKEIGLTEKSEFKKHFNFFDRYYEDEKKRTRVRFIGMSMTRKYKQGKLIESVAQFEQWVNAGNNFVIVNTRTTHVGWCISWQYNYLKNVIGQRWMYEAIKISTDKEEDK